jgi:hypothetical protein
VHKTTNILNKVALLAQANIKKDLPEIYLANRASADVAIDVFAEKYGAKYDNAVEVPDERSRRNACVLQLLSRALGSLANSESHRQRVRDGLTQDGANERLVVVNDCQVDGVRAGVRRIEDLAAAERFGCRSSSQVSESKTASRSSKCRQTTPPDRLVTQNPHSA